MAAPEPISSKADLKRTPLHALHLELGAKMVPFAGYEMPVSFPQGLLKEHLHTRQAAGLFDVSHMGQAMLTGPSHAVTAAALERLVPGDIAGLKPGRQRYTQLLTGEGGIIDDLMVTRPAAADDDGRLLLIVNAARKDVDYPHIAAALPADVALSPQEARALLALQGPAAAQIMGGLCPGAAQLGFMAARPLKVAGIDCHISRSGYTGEDGFEISVAADRAEELARTLLSDQRVAPVGLGARDTLSHAAAHCLSGHDIAEPTSPAEADRAWTTGKRRREEGGFPGAERVLRELADGPARRRVGLKLAGRAPAREGCEIVGAGGEPLGKVTSGSFAPSVGGPIAMGYVTRSHSEPGTPVTIIIRGTAHPATVVPMPFMPHRYFRKTRSGTPNG
jgi:aminomethyltransferase